MIIVSVLYWTTVLIAIMTALWKDFAASCVMRTDEHRDQAGLQDTRRNKSRKIKPVQVSWLSLPMLMRTQRSGANLYEANKGEVYGSDKKIHTAFWEVEDERMVMRLHTS